MHQVPDRIGNYAEETKTLYPLAQILATFWIRMRINLQNDTQQLPPHVAYLGGAHRFNHGLCHGWASRPCGPL